MNIQSYIGIPFKEKGRDREGLDCWGLFRLIYKDALKIDLPSYVEEYATTEEREVIHHLISTGLADWSPIKTPQLYDGILFRIFGTETHIGMMLDSQTMIHVHVGIDTCIEPVYSPRWKSRLVGFFRHRSQI